MTTESQERQLTSSQLPATLKGVTQAGAPGGGNLGAIEDPAPLR